jgi:hypothetical protein
MQVEESSKSKNIRGSIFLEGVFNFFTGKWRVLVPSTTNGDTLGEALNLCKIVSKQKYLTGGRSIIMHNPRER